ncbi:MAG TPA: SPOR domain-containing protein [Candidatus Omnitrophota bacterium]|nr:SPOR domain-containing protein [Candidatus Omnitrophota bacterium]HPD83902.1 SPOR domain-containing protein [Candidatus Omnitrophota bacterium]HRZ02759.1 SPOR domain-containing protein [Candidatus Omnitrophota bacterium]
MRINYKQSQFELFPDAIEGAEKDIRPRHFFSSLTFSFENIVISGIFILMAIVIAFSLGVEKGKGIGAIALPVSQPRQISVAREGNVALNPAQAAAAPVASSIRSSVPVAITEPKRNENTKEELTQPVEIASGAYTIQVASFKSKDYAQKEAGALKKNGYNSLIIPKKNHLIVCVGKFSGKDQAQVVLTQLKKKYKDCMIRRL